MQRVTPFAVLRPLLTIAASTVAAQDHSVASENLR